MFVVDSLLSATDFREPIVLTVGTFDGVHLGHRIVLREVCQKAKARNGTSVVITFEPYPQEVLNPQNAPPRLMSREEKLDALDDLGIGVTVVLPFTGEFSQLSAPDFMSGLISGGLKLAEMVVGSDHGFGRNRKGDFRLLEKLGEKFGFEVNLIPPITINGEKVSSTKIREFIGSGDMGKARIFLGQFYSMKGEVVKGDGRGRKFGFPTANIRVYHPRKLLPPLGVYAVLVKLDGKNMRGIMNIGDRPTFEAGFSLEVHIFDFSGDLYGRSLTVQFVERLRGERRFNLPEELIEQIRQDGESALSILPKF